MTEEKKLYWPIEKLKLWDKNPRGITKQGFARLERQIDKLGEYKPLLITIEGEWGIVLGGNMRLLVYQKKGKKKAWVSPVDAPDDKTKLEYALSDNDRAGYYEDEALAELLTGVPDFNLEDFKVDLGEPMGLEDILDRFRPTEEDEVPELPKEPQSKRGEIYELGRHRLMCGDATSKKDVEKLMGGEKADMVFTDPPYGVGYEEKTKSITHQRKDKLPVSGDELSLDDVKRILEGGFQNINEVLKSGGAYYICSPQGGDRGLMMMATMKDCGIECRHVLIWVKNSPVFAMGRLDYSYKHEPILYGWKDSHRFYGRNEVSVWEIPKPAQSKLHPTMKPVALCAKAIKNSSKPNEAVLDLFGGSGSTLIACEQLDRTCYMMEIDPAYCDVIRERYNRFDK